MLKLIDLANEISKQDNSHTQYPIFEVREMERVYGKDLQLPDGHIYVDPNDFEVSFEEEQDALEYCRENDIDLEDLEVFEYQEVEKTVAYFLTRDATQTYIDQNSHHFHEPFIYIESAWRNWQIQSLVAEIFKLADRELPHFWK